MDQFKKLMGPEHFLRRKPDLNNDELRLLLAKGQVKKTTLQKLWPDRCFKFLTKVMTTFGLMLPLSQQNNQERFLVPCMLPPGDDPAEEAKQDPLYSSFVYESIHQEKDVTSFSQLIFKFFKSNWKIQEKGLSGKFASFQHLGTSEEDPRLKLFLVKKEVERESRIGIRVCCEYKSVKTLTKKLEYLAKHIRETAGECNLPPSTESRLLCPLRNRGDGQMCHITLDESSEQPIRGWHCSLHRHALISIIHKSIQELLKLLEGNDWNARCVCPLVCLS